MDEQPRLDLIAIGPSIKPLIETLNQDYEFKVKLTASGGSTLITTKKSLRVGCTSSMIVAYPEDFLTEKYLPIGSSRFNAYTIFGLISDREYCQPTKYKIPPESIYVNGERTTPD